MKIIVGLGNPDNQYLKTRHNVGWMVLDELAERMKEWDNQIKWTESQKAKAWYIKTNINSQMVELIKPITYMNNSGLAVAMALKNHNAKIDTDLIVIHDDKDIELGKIKVQKDHSSAGHRGVQSIIDQLKTQNFTRVRIGVKNKRTERMDTAQFILKNFGLLEKRKLKIAIDQAIKEIFSLM